MIFRLDEEAIDMVKTALSRTKEESFDGERWEAEPEIDFTDKSGKTDLEHSEWSARTWDMFDALPASEVEDVLKKFPWLKYDKNGTIEDVYELLDDLCENMGR